MRQLEGRARLARIALHSDPTTLIVLLAALTGTWGMAMALDGAFKSNPFYSLFAMSIPDEAWIGLPAVVGAIVQLVGLWRRWYRITLWVTRTEAAAWFGLGTGLFASGISGPAPYLDAVIGLSAVWACVLLAARMACHVHG